MNSNQIQSQPLKRPVILSTLWIFVLFNYLYCDLLSNMQASTLNDLLSGNVAGMDVNSGFLLGAAVLMEIPIAMILLSRILPFRANRWANIIAGAIMSLVQISSLFVGSGPELHYIFYSVIEISCTATIFWLALNWRE